VDVLRRDFETITLSSGITPVNVYALNLLLCENSSKSKKSVFFEQNPLAGHASCDVYCGARRDGW
jgi:hypothetical protein